MPYREAARKSRQRLDKKTQDVDGRAISLGSYVRFGTSGPTFEEIGAVLCGS